MDNFKHRILWIDLIKVFAIFSVLVLHIAAPILEQYNNISLSSWHIGNIYDSAVRMSVPLFFMISGVLLLNSKEENLNTFFKKRFLKVVIPLIVWTFLYILFRKYIQHQDINIFIQLFKGILSPRYFHLWFLYVIVGIYLILPLLKILINNSTTKMQIYFLLLWLYSFSIIPSIGEFTGQNIPNYLPMMSSFIGFLVLGFLLEKIKISKKFFYISILLAIASTAIAILGTYYLTEKANKFIPFFYHYSNIIIIIQASAYFIMMRYIAEEYISNMPKLKSIIFTISFTSLGIYLIHPMILFLLREKMGIYALNGGNPTYTILLTLFLTYILSFFTIYLIQKIPILKQIVPR